MKIVTHKIYLENQKIKLGCVNGNFVKFCEVLHSSMKYKNIETYVEDMIIKDYIYFANVSKNIIKFVLNENLGYYKTWKLYLHA